MYCDFAIAEMEKPVLPVLQQMADRSQSAAPVVTSVGKLSANISLSDLKVRRYTIGTIVAAFNILLWFQTVAKSGKYALVTGSVSQFLAGVDRGRTEVMLPTCMLSTCAVFIMNASADHESLHFLQPWHHAGQGGVHSCKYRSAPSVCAGHERDTKGRHQGFRFAQVHCIVNTSKLRIQNFYFIPCGKALPQPALNARERFG